MLSGEQDFHLPQGNMRVPLACLTIIDVYPYLAPENVYASLADDDLPLVVQAEVRGIRTDVLGNV